MILKGKIVEVKRNSCYNGFYKNGINYVEVIEYHFKTEDEATEFFYTLKDNKELAEKVLGK